MEGGGAAHAAILQGGVPAGDDAARGGAHPRWARRAGRALNLGMGLRRCGRGRQLKTEVAAVRQLVLVGAAAQLGASLSFGAGIVSLVACAV